MHPIYVESLSRNFSVVVSSRLAYPRRSGRASPCAMTNGEYSVTKWSVISSRDVAIHSLDVDAIVESLSGRLSRESS